MAHVLAKRNARQILPARSLKAAEAAKSRIVSEFPDSEIVLSLRALDLSSLTSVRRRVRVSPFSSESPNKQGREILAQPRHLRRWSRDDLHYKLFRSSKMEALEYADLDFFMASKLLQTIPQGVFSLRDDSASAAWRLIRGSGK